MARLEALIGRLGKTSYKSDFLNSEIGRIAEIIRPERKIAQLTLLLYGHHPVSALHGLEVGCLAAELAFGLGKDPKTFFNGGLLHDIGKIGTPRSILDKTDPLTEYEKEILNEHREAGAAVIEAVGLDSLYAIFCREHHIDNNHIGDGSHTLSLEEELKNRHEDTPIISIADILSAAMDVLRSYKKPMGLEEARKHINKTFDQGIFPQTMKTIFNQMLDEGIYPPYINSMIINKYLPGFMNDLTLFARRQRVSLNLVK